MIVLIGPCMFVAPLMILLVPVAIVLWPVAVVVLGVGYLAIWPFALVATRMGDAWLPARHRWVGKWFLVVLRPWNFFDLPKKRAPSSPGPG